MIKAIARAFLIAGFVFSIPAQAETSFAGRTITVIVPFQKGSETDSSARTVLTKLISHLPGKPAIDIKNIPGADSVKGANVFHKTAKPDGLTVLAASVPTLMNFILRSRGVKYNLKAYTPVLLTQNPFTVRSRPKTKTLKGLRAVYLATKPASGDLLKMLMLELLGVHIKTKWNADRKFDPDTLPENKLVIRSQRSKVLIDDVDKNPAGQVAFIPRFTSGILKPGGGIGRDPKKPDQLHFLEYYKTKNNRELGGNPRKAFHIFFHASVAARLVLLLPANISRSIRDTYDAAAREVAGTNPLYLTGDAVRRAHEKAVGFDPKFTDWLQNYVRLHKGRL